MEEDLIEFKNYLMKTKKSELTIESYIYDVQAFVNYLNDKKIDNLTEVIMHKYTETMMNDNKKITTINRHMVSINHYLKFRNVPYLLKPEKYQTQNFLDNIINNEEYGRLIQSTKDNNDIRAECIFSTLFLTGMRVSEMLQLTVYDIEKTEIIIKGKGSKYREIFISDKLRNIWRSYSLHRIKKTSKLFTGQKGELTRQTVNCIIKKYARMCGIDTKKVHAHVLRHLYGKTLSDKNVPIDTLADLLGHTNINITRIYTRKTKQELLDIIGEL